jgi:hypothetical protein
MGKNGQTEQITTNLLGTFNHVGSETIHHKNETTTPSANGDTDPGEVSQHAPHLAGPHASDHNMVDD